MSEQSFDSAAYKAGQREQWDSVSSGWEKWWEVFERSAQQVSDRLVDLAGVKQGHRVLDVATGIGEPAVTAAKRTGSSGEVVATDQSPNMLAIARRRAENEGLRHLEFREMEAEELTLTEKPFDAAVCRWGLMFLPNMEAALQRLHEVLVSGATFATAVWDTPDNVPAISMPMGVIKKMIAPPPPPPDAPNLFKLAAPGLLEGAMAQAGFIDITTERMTVTLEFSSADEYTRWIGDIAAPVIALIAQEPESRQREIWQAVTDEARSFSVNGGVVRMANTAILVSGKKA